VGSAPPLEESTTPARDLQLAAALRRGDTQLFTELVDTWSPAMLRIARAHVADHHAAEDVVQEAWIAALRGLERFEGRSSLRTWVCGIVVNIARRHGTRQRKQVPVSSLDTGRRAEWGPTVDPARFQREGEKEPGGWRQFPMPWPLPEDAALNMEIQSVIQAAIARLPDRQRVVMELRDLHGYDGQEVAALLSVSIGNQRVLLHRARALVRRELETYFAGRQR
jgi:RNA polymerase sigma-70 factor (ECF subfamily)